MFSRVLVSSSCIVNTITRFAMSPPSKVLADANDAVRNRRRAVPIACRAGHLAEIGLGRDRAVLGRHAVRLTHVRHARSKEPMGWAVAGGQLVGAGVRGGDVGVQTPVENGVERDHVAGSD